MKHRQTKSTLYAGWTELLRLVIYISKGRLPPVVQTAVWL